MSITFVGQSLLQSLGVTRVNQLTPKGKKLYAMVKSKEKVRCLTFQLQKSKERSRATVRKKDVADIEWLQAQGLNRVSAEFVKAQITMSCRQARTRRYNSCLKLLGVALMKKSPSQYKLMNKIFATPSRRTLDRVI